MDDAIAWESMQSSLLEKYDEQIRQCLECECWEELIAVLDARLVYLSSVFSATLPVEYREAARGLIASVLKIDAEFLDQIQLKKSLLSEQQLTIQRNCRAIQSYSELIP